MAEESDSTSSLFRVLGRGGSLNLVGAVCQQASVLGTTAVIARVLGEQYLGRYVIAFALLSLLSLVAQLGFRAALTRFVAAYLAESQHPQVRRLVRFSVLVSGGFSVVLGLAMIGCAHPLARVFHDPGLYTGLIVVGAALPAFTLRDLGLAAIQGWRTQRAFALIGWVYEPIVRFGLTAVSLALGFGLAGAFGALLVGSWTAALAAAVALARRLRSAPRYKVTIDVRHILGFAFAAWGTSLTASGLIWADTLLLGALADTDSVGTYNVATRLVSLAIFILAPVDALFSPHFAHFHHQRDMTRLGATYASATNWILRLSLPAFVVVTVFPASLLRLFGPGFAAGATVTLLLAFGQLTNASTGPCGSLLNMSGRVRLNLAYNVAGLVLNIVLNLILIPPFGIVGAGFAWSISLALLNVAKLLQVRRLMGMLPFDLVTAKSLTAAATAAVVAIVSRLVLPSDLIATLAGILLIYLSYAVMTAVLRFSPDELETIKGVFRSGSRPNGYEKSA